MKKQAHSLVDTVTQGRENFVCANGTNCKAAFQNSYLF